MRYRRAFTPAGTFFFTVVTANRKPLLATAEEIGILREAFRSVRVKHPFSIDAAVILPDHFHCILTLPPGVSDFSKRLRLIKTWYTKHTNLERPVITESRRAKQGQMIWQHRYWEHLIRDDADYEAHVDYIHYNPVKHGLVTRPIDWPWSSLRRFAAAGLLPPTWGTGGIELAKDIGCE